MSDYSQLPDISGVNAEDSSATGESARGRGAFHWTLWGMVGLFFLIVFTLLKLPEDRLRNYIQGSIAAALSQQDIGFSAEKSSLSLGLGIHYTMRNITLTFLPPQEPVKIEKISFTPSILSLMTGHWGGSVELDNRGGSLTVSFSKPMTSKTNEMSVSYSAERLDLGALGVLPALANLRGSGILSGSGAVDGDTAIPSTLNGQVEINLAKVAIESQTVLGFSLPAMNISEGHLNLRLDRGKAALSRFTLGKTGNAADDLQANLTGDVGLGRTWPTSTLNVRADFRLSPAVIKAFPLLDALLGDGKQPDGSFSYRLTGPMGSPFPQGIRSGAH